MPIYEFHCKKCDEDYEALTKFDETSKYKTVSCPNCGSKSKEKLVSETRFNFTNPIGTDRWCSDSMGHDYRYNYNLPNVRRERELAEKQLKGDKPYKDLDEPTKEGIF